MDLSHDAGGVIKATTVQGGQGLDTITFSADASTTASSVYILGGGGNDAISAHLDATFVGSTVAGGGAADTLVVDATTASAVVVLGDAMNNIDSYDGNDTITSHKLLPTALPSRVWVVMTRSLPISPQLAVS